MTMPCAQEPIAVVGMDCIFPQAPDLKTYWQNILNGVDAIGEPLPAWNAPLYKEKMGVVSTEKGGYLRDLYRFNPTEFGIMPNSIDGGEPDQFLALQVAKRALADAGEAYLDAEYDHEGTGIILGHSPYFHRGQINGAQHYTCMEQSLELIRSLLPEMTPEQEKKVESALRDQLPPYNTDVCPSMVPNVMTGRIANRLNFNGPNYMVDAACASSLLAVNAAIEELRNGNSRMMLVGGVNASLPAQATIIFTQLDALCKSGQVRPFSSSGDGTLLGEGLGIVVLKRLSDALADGDRVYSVLRGVGQSSDGRGFGLLTPSEKGETLAIRRAYESTGIDPASVSLIEAHGTGIPLGDKTEIASLKNVFGERRGEQGTIPVGSVKSMISHCIPAAGIASLIKTSLALYHKILPPTLCEEVSPELGIEQTPFYINTEVRPWIHEEQAPRRAAINSFGFGGVNAHSIIEEAPRTALAPAKCAPWSEELFVFAGESSSDLNGQLDRVQSFIERRDDVALADIAYSVQLDAQGRDGAHRLAVVAKNRDDLTKKLEQARKRLAKSEDAFSTRNGLVYTSKPVTGALAFMFPGEGSQYLNMLADVALHFDAVREWLDFWHGLYDGESDMSRTDIVFPPLSEMTEQRRQELERKLHSMEIGSEAAFIAGQAMFSLLTELGVEPDVMVGHSTGESGALLAAGAVPSSDKKELAGRVRQINSLARMVEEDGGIPTGALMAIGLISRSVIDEAIDGTEIVIAMENCPTQTIVYGSPEDVEALSETLRAKGAVCELLPFDRGYHTAAFEPMREAFLEFYREVGLGVPTIPLFSCASADYFPQDEEGILELATRQWVQSVRFSDTVRAMFADGVRYFVEVGPGGKLASFAEQILRTDGVVKECVVTPSNLESQSGLQTLLQLMGILYVNQRLMPHRLFEGRQLRQLDLSVLDKPRMPGLFMDNSIPQLRATPELVRLFDEIREQTPANAVEPVVRGYEGEDAFLPDGADTEQVGPELVFEADPEVTEGPFPFLTEITRFSEDDLTAQVALSVHEDCFLQDHVLSGGPVSEDADLHGLACVPLMVSLEIMAEACAALAGRVDLSVIENLRAERWILLDAEETVLEVRAWRRADQPDVVRAELFQDGERAAGASYRFGPYCVPEAQLEPVVQEEPFWIEGEYGLYRDHVIFHGPLFQTVRDITACSREAIEADLSPASLEGFFRPGEAPQLVLNPVLVDSLNQLTAFWLTQKLGPYFASFPSAVERIELYADYPENVEGLSARAYRREVEGDGQDGLWDIECRLGDDVVIRIFDLRNAFTKLPEDYCLSSTEPINGWLGYPLQAQSDDLLHWEMPHLPLALSRRMGGVFLRNLAHIALHDVERRQWLALPDVAQLREEWLYRRVAIKEAVRYSLYQCTGQRFYSTDVIVEENQDGEFFVDGWWASELVPPAVSVTTGESVTEVELLQAVAFAGRSQAMLG